MKYVRTEFNKSQRFDTFITFEFSDQSKDFKWHNATFSIFIVFWGNNIVLFVVYLFVQIHVHVLENSLCKYCEYPFLSNFLNWRYKVQINKVIIQQNIFKFYLRKKKNANITLSIYQIASELSNKSGASRYQITY